MEQQITTTADGQVVIQPIQSVAPQQVQVMQMNPGQVIQGANGQQIMVHAVPPGQIQVAAPGNTQGIQQIQVVPVSSLQQTGQVLVQPQQQTAQLVQTADGQTFIYQAIGLEGGSLQQATPTGEFYLLFVLQGVEGLCNCSFF